jgi:FixJ family two-component response regulator
MEPLDGIKTTREIRSHYSDLDVVALTSSGEAERVRAALEAGTSGYLLKDSDADEVSAAIRAAHRGELPLDPATGGLTSSLRSESPGGRDAELTTRELKVLRVLGAGKSNRQIADERSYPNVPPRTESRGGGQRSQGHDQWLDGCEQPARERQSMRRHRTRSQLTPSTNHRRS